MQINIKRVNSVAVWRWVIPNDGSPDDGPAAGAAGAGGAEQDEEEEDVCGICRVPYDGCCPDCKLPGDDCPLSASRVALYLLDLAADIGLDHAHSLGTVLSRLPHALLDQMDPARKQQAAVSDGPETVG